jgi:hypothetical protein
MADVRKALVSIALIWTLAATLLNAAKHDFQTGKLINIDSEEKSSRGPAIGMPS